MPHLALKQPKTNKISIYDFSAAQDRNRLQHQMNEAVVKVTCFIENVAFFAYLKSHCSCTAALGGMSEPRSIIFTSPILPACPPLALKCCSLITVFCHQRNII